MIELNKPVKQGNRKDVVFSGLRLSSVDLGLFIRYVELENAITTQTAILQRLVETMVESIKAESEELHELYNERPEELREIFQQVTMANQKTLSKPLKVRGSRDLSLEEIMKQSPSLDLEL